MPSVLVEPAFLHCPDYYKTYGPEVGELAALAGLTPDPEQQLVLDGMFGVDRRGKSVAFEICVICCRQNGKTGLMKMAALGKTLLLKRSLYVWSAHEFSMSSESFRDLKVMIESSQYLDRQVKKIREGSGQESIEWLNGCRIKFKARTKTGGRGLSGDDVGLDEAFALQSEHMGALIPTLSARPDPQVAYYSSAGHADSAVLRSVRDRGRKGSSPRLLYVEWCAPEHSCEQGNGCDHALGTVGCALDLVENYEKANPALGRRITVEYVQAERQAVAVEEFARERLGWWDDPTGDSAIPLAKWNAQQSEHGFDGEPWFALDVSPKLTYAAIAAAGFRVDGSPHVEITLREDQQQSDYRQGTGWVLPAIRDLHSRWPGMRLAVGAGSQAMTLVPDIEELGVQVVTVAAGDVTAACGRFYALVAEGGVWHSGQLELTAAVSAGQWRDTGEGAQVFGRRKTDTDIAGLYAATLAVTALLDHGEGLGPDDIYVGGF